MNKKAQKVGGVGLTLILIVILLFIGGLFYIAPKYSVWERGLAGQAQLKQAEWNRQIKIREAEANLEAEKLNALAEIERAKGVAESNKIIGEGLKDNDEYIKYLWVKGLSDGHSEVIYVPTEASLPILEAGRFD
jgi:hypothetical protein